MKQGTRKPSKKFYIILLSGTVVAILAVVAVSLMIGLGVWKSPDNSGETPVDNPIDNPGDNPSDTPTDDPGGSPTDDPGDSHTDDPGGTPADNPSDTPVDTTTYKLPLSSYTIGKECSLSTVVWSSTLRWYETHNGTDFMAEKNTPVMAVYDGTVTQKGYTTQDGYVVSILQADGITATYKSLSSDIVVEVNDTVTAGMTIGYVSDSMASEQNDGAHLHLEMKDAENNFIDPMTKLPANTPDK